MPFIFATITIFAFIQFSEDNIITLVSVKMNYFSLKLLIILYLSLLHPELMCPSLWTRFINVHIVSYIPKVITNDFGSLVLMMVNFENHIMKYFLLWLGCWSSSLSFILTTTLVTQDLSSERTSLGSWILSWKIPAWILWWRKLLSVWKDKHKTLKCTEIRTFFREVKLIHSALKITEIKTRSPGSIWLLITSNYLSLFFFPYNKPTPWFANLQ